MNTQPLLSYKVFFWTVFIITTTLFVADRFTTNVWPRNDFNQPGVGDRMTVREGPWTIVFDDINSKFSGRYTIWCLCFMFFTMMHTTHFYLGRSWIGRHLVDFNDHNARISVHRWLGISLCIVTILHVSSMLLPVMFSGYDLIVNPGYFVWPLSEAAPKGFKQADVEAKLMMMQVDDVYRLILIYVLLGPIIFLSVQWMAGNYRFGIRLHQFVGLMYFIDISRRHSHPHCWVYNLPCFIAWILDLAWGHIYLHQRTLVKRVIISENYMFLYFKSLVPVSEKSIGNYYHLRCSCSMCGNWERSHPFTHMNKRGVIVSSFTSIAHSHDKFNLKYGKDFTIHEPEEWDKGILVRTYKGALAHTRKMRDVPELEMDLWGSFPIDSIAHYVDSKDDVILVGAGSGSIFLLDCLTYLASYAKSIDKRLNKSDKNKTEDSIWSLASPDLYHPNITPRISQLLFKTYTTGHMVEMKTGDPNNQNNIKKSIGIIQTSNDPQLVQFFVSVVDDIMMRNVMPKCIGIKITIALTKKMENQSFSIPDVSWGKIKLGRVDFGEEIQKLATNGGKCHLFCQGGPSIQSAVREAAKETGHTYHEAHSFDSGPASFEVRCGCTGV